MLDHDNFDLRRSIQGMQLISLALAMGVLMFVGVVVVLSRTAGATAPAPDEAGVERLLSMVHLVFFGLALAGSLLLFRGVFSPRRILATVGSDNLTEGDMVEVVQLYQKAHVLRLACVEGAALLGAVTCLLAVLSGRIVQEPLYWLNLGSAGVFLLYTVATFPTAGRVERLLAEGLRRAQELSSLQK